MKTFLLLCALLAATSLSACGQRVYPSNPEGKLIPSQAY
jgi:hypothetical protein